MKEFIPNPKILCCASIFALSLAACSQQPSKPKPQSLVDNSVSSTSQVKLKKGFRSKKLGLALPDPRSYDNLWDRLFDRFDLPEVSHPDIDREFNWFINHPAYIERVQSRAEPFLYSIVKQLEKHNIPGELALLPVIESAFQPHVVSPAHAAGIWQFIPATGRHYGLKQSHSYDGRRDIYASTRAAIKYLKKLRNDFNGDWLLAIAGYNCGEGAVARAIQKNLARGLPTDFWSLELPQETRSYVPRLLAVSRLFADADQYGVSLRPIPNQALYKTVKMNNQVDLALAANAANISLDRLFELNPGFKRQQVDLDGSYRLFIPAHKKIVDFKEELARQIASSQGYSERDMASSPTAETGFGTATSATDTTIAGIDSKPVEVAAVQPVAQAPSAAEKPAYIAEPAAPAPVEKTAYVSPVAEPAEVAQPAEKLAYADNTATTPQATIPAETPDTTESFVTEPVVQTPALKTKSKLSSRQPDETLAATEQPETRPSRTLEPQAKPTRKDGNDAATERLSKLADERIAASSAKPTAKTLPAKAGQKDRDEPPIAAHPKTSERGTFSADRDDERPGHKTTHAEPDTIPGKKVAYVVQEGDTAYSIARRHDMDVDDLKKLNHLSHAEDIKWGQSLTVVGKDKEAGKKQPAAKAGAKQSQLSKYTARDGETLFSISRRFNVTVADLRKWNGIKEDRQFRAGMNINVSGERD